MKRKSFQINVFAMMNGEVVKIYLLKKKLIRIKHREFLKKRFRDVL